MPLLSDLENHFAKSKTGKCYNYSDGQYGIEDIEGPPHLNGYLLIPEHHLVLSLKFKCSKITLIWQGHINENSHEKLKTSYKVYNLSQVKQSTAYGHDKQEMAV